MSQLHAAALSLARLGCAIFPCQPRDKTPACRNGFKDATINPAHIDTWWEACPDLNIGIATGTPSGFFVLDIDNDKDGEASLRKLEEAYGALPPTVESVTGKGRHCYFRQGEYGPVGCSRDQIGPGLDIRGDGGYVIAPPSIHPNGGVYRWSVDSASDFAEAPDWLHAQIAITGAAAKQGKTVAEWHDVLTQPIKQGARDDTLASIAGKLLARDIHLLLVLDLLMCVNIARCEPPLPLGDVHRITMSINDKRARGQMNGRAAS
jgi:Bifunctional DNA primase/polymerase, N-terminal/Primase C terminal 1 (PriCT-1)